VSGRRKGDVTFTKELVHRRQIVGNVGITALILAVITVVLGAHHSVNELVTWGGITAIFWGLPILLVVTLIRAWWQ
jgi:TM2 domain-containing membrane protein YozV